MIGIEGAFVRVPLGELGAWRTGSTPSKNVPTYWKGGGTPWVSPKDFGSAVILDAMDHLAEAAFTRGGARTVPAGSLLIVSRSGVLRHSLPVAIAGRELATNQDVRALLPTPGVHAGFIRHQLLAAQSRVLLEAVRRGTTVESLDDAAFRAVEVLLPAPAEQERIAASLDRLDEGLSGIRAQVATARRNSAGLREQVLAGAWTGGLTARWRAENGRDDRWPKAAIKDVAEMIAYGSSSKSSRTGEVAVLRMGNIQGGRLSWDDLVYTSDQEEIRRHLLVDGDLLFNRTNSPELVGKSAVYHGERPAIAAGYNVVVRCGERVLPDFLAHLINGPAGRAWCRSVRSDGVNQSNISASKLAALEVPIPPVDEQREVLRVVDAALGKLSSVALALDDVERDCDELARTVRNSAYRSSEAEARSTPELQHMLNAIAASIIERRDEDQKRRSDMAARRKTTRSVEEIVGERRSEGMTFAELLAAAGTDYETVRTSVFSALAADPPRLRQQFDPDGPTMRLKAVRP